MTATPPPTPADELDGPGAEAYGTLLKAALDQVPASSVMVFDRDLVYRVARGGALAPRGFDPARVEGHPVQEVLADRWPIYEDAYVGALEGRSSRFEVTSPDGTRIFEIHTAPLRDDTDAVSGGISVAVDVTEPARQVAELAISEERWRRTMEDAPIAMMIVSPEGGFLDVNPAACALYGRERSELLSLTWQELTHPDDLDKGLGDVADLLAGRIDSIRVRKRFVRSDGSVMHADLSVSPIRDAGGEALFQVAQMVDVTEQVRSEERLRRSEDELRMILDSSPDAIVRLDGEGRILFVNATVGANGIIDTEGLVGSYFADFAPPDANDDWGDHIRAVFATGEAVSFEIQVGEVWGNAWWDVRIVPTLDERGQVTHVTVLARDISSQKHAELALLDAATHDPLTGLANRAELYSEIERALSASARSGAATAVMMLDLDRFKGVNDSLGHATGDGLLLAAARRIQATVRGGDMAGRLGGDEFVVVMRDLADPTESARVAERLVAAFREPMAVGDLALVTTASVGLTVADAESATDPARLLDEADTALYAAKQSGRDRLSYFDDALRTVVDARRRTEDELRHALDRGELELWFQPEIDLATGRVRAAEALLRWRHPSGELMAAERFIHVAEESGLILDIGDWVVREACRQAASWAADRPEDPPVVRVNLSLAQLSDVELGATVRGALHAAGLPAHLLCVEVDEGTLLRSAAVTAEALAALREMGVLVAVDAFGTGDTPLSYLRDFPVDVLKLDRSFVTTLVDDDGDRRLVAGILALAGELDLPVTAKSVETDDQLEALRRLGCETAQGWVFWPAIEPARITSLLHAERDR